MTDYTGNPGVLPDPEELLAKKRQSRLLRVALGGFGGGCSALLAAGLGLILAIVGNRWLGLLGGPLATLTAGGLAVMIAAPPKRRLRSVAIWVPIGAGVWAAIWAAGTAWYGWRIETS